MAYNVLGQHIATVDRLNKLTGFKYDGLGRIEQTVQYIDPRRPPYGNPLIGGSIDLLQDTSTTYDAWGNRLSQTDAEGNTTTFSYDSLNRVITTTSAAGVTHTQTYNALGWVIITTNGLGHTATSTYDELGRVITATDAAGNTTAYTYDGLGNQVLNMDAESVQTRYDYDELNRLVAIVENWDGVTASLCQAVPSVPDSNVCTQYQYDILGNQVHITNALGITNTTTVYDVLQRPVLVRDALGRETRTQYNALGHQVVVTDASGDVTQYAYDPLNRLMTIDYQDDGEMVQYAYDVVGNRTAMTDSLGVTSYEYDNLYRLKSVTYPLTGTVSYEYDKVGNRTKVTYPNGQTAEYEYDADNRLELLYELDNDQTGYQYDAAGHLITTTQGIFVGGRIVHEYDRVGQLVRLTHYDKLSSNVLSDYQYVLDGVGNRLVATETLRLPDNTLQTTVITYTYDGLYRLTSAVHTGDITATYRYEYDAVGNMEAYTETVGTNTAVVARTFDDANQLQTSTDTQLGTTSFYYDDNGNLEQILPPGVGSGNWAGALRYGYDQRNLLITSTVYLTTTGWSDQVQYIYDGDGHRVRQVDHTGSQPITTTYVNDNEGLSTVLMASNGLTTTYMLAGPDIMRQEDGSESRMLLTDGLGSTRLETSGFNTMETVSTYEPFGKLLVRAGETGTVYGYAGEQFDAGSGLVYLRARYYNPNLKLFMSRDPFSGWDTLPASQHPYAYSHNNPVNYTDPTGQKVPVGEILSGLCPNPWICAGLIGLAMYASSQNLPDITLPPDIIDDASDFFLECGEIVEQAFQNTDPERKKRPGDPPPPPPPWDDDDDDKLQLYHYTDAEGFAGIMSSGYIRWSSRDKPVFPGDADWRGVNFTDISPQEIRAYPTVQEGRAELAHYLWMTNQGWAFDRTEYWIRVELSLEEVVPVTEKEMYPIDERNDFHGRLYYIYRGTEFWLTNRKDVTCGRTEVLTPFATCLNR